MPQYLTNAAPEVKVTLPLLREMPKNPDSSNSTTSTTKSLISVPRDVDQSIVNLRAKVIGQKVSLAGFKNESEDPALRETGRLLQASITTFLVSWYGLQVVPLGQKANLIIANEAEPNVISKLANHAAQIHRNYPPIVVLCSHNSRYKRGLSPPGLRCHVGFIAKPVGPLKLAKAILACFDGDFPLATPGVEIPSNQADSSDLSNVFEGLSLSPHGGEVLDNSRMASDSENARKAIESPTPNAFVEKAAEFPFPEPRDKTSVSKGTAVPGDKKSPSTSLGIVDTLAATFSHSSKVKTASKAPKPSKPKLRSPTLLLVDDNQINIRLLSTYLNRRGYETIHEAQNGLEAVHSVEARPEGYDIIFMDITMPVLDGFGATAQVRAIENKRAETAKSRSGGAGGSPALIIAFTGRSSIEDQTEAVRCGIDLFMTKPVAFKEVGKIIDNWVANRGKEATGSETELEKKYESGSEAAE